MSLDFHDCTPSTSGGHEHGRDFATGGFHEPTLCLLSLHQRDISQSQNAEWWHVVGVPLVGCH